MPSGAHIEHPQESLHSGMANLELQQPLEPQAEPPLKRVDTKTSELDTFVDAEG